MKLKEFWNNRSKKGKGCLGCFTVFVLFMILGVAFSDPSDTTDTTEDTSSQPAEEQEQVAQQDSEDTEEALVADYEVVETEDISVLNIKRVNYRIVVPTTIKREQIRPTVEKIISDIAGEDNDIDEISILVYSSEELASGSYDIAMAEWAPEGDWGSTTADIAENNTRDTHELKLETREDLENYLEGLNSDVITAENPEAVFDVPNLLNENISYLSTKFEEPVNENPDPTEAAVQAGAETWSKIFEKGDYMLSVTYNIDTGNVTEIFLSEGTYDMSIENTWISKDAAAELLVAGNLSKDDPGYFIRFFSPAQDNNMYTGVEVKKEPFRGFNGEVLCSGYPEC